MSFVQTRSCRASSLLVVLGLLVFASASAAQATVEEPRGDLTLASAIALALARNPDLSASRYEITAAEARTLQAGLRPDATLSVQFENFAGTGAARDVQILEATLSLSQVIELGDKRDRRLQVAGAGREVIEIEQQAVELDVLAAVTQRFLAVVGAQERVAVTRSNAELARKTLASIVARVEAARSPEAERSRASIVLTRAGLDAEQALSELRAARQALSATWGGLEPQFARAQGDLFRLQEVEPFSTLTARLERSPEFVRFASEARLREAELQLARAQARPDLTLDLGVRRLQQTRDHALVAGFSIPLAIRNRNQGEIREAEVRRAQSTSQRQASFVRARATLFSLYQEVSTARARLQTLTQEALPQAQLALSQTQSGYDRGRFSFLELSIAQQEPLALREGAIAAALDYHRARTEIERLTGEPLSLGTEQELP